VLFTSEPVFLLVFLLTAVVSAWVGVWLTGVPELSRRIVPFSGALLIVISLGWILPELARDFGWSTGSSLMLSGFALVWLVDRHVYPVCPSCSHTHDHDSCSTRLHGFAAPLIVGSSLHTIFDGWALATSSALSIGVLLHKIPEGLAFGVILRAALRSRRLALFWTAVTQVGMLAGAALEKTVATHIGTPWMGVLLAFGGGTFLYLGFHAVHGEWKRRAAQEPGRV